MPDNIIIVHTLDDVRAALKTSSGHTVIMQSAPDAIFYAGALYLLTMFQQASAEYPDCKATFILDCADSGAQAISAMQMGHTHIRSSAAAPLFAKLQDIANQLGVVLLCA